MERRQFLKIVSLSLFSLFFMKKSCKANSVKNTQKNLNTKTNESNNSIDFYKFI